MRQTPTFHRIWIGHLAEYRRSPGRLLITQFDPALFVLFGVKIGLCFQCASAQPHKIRDVPSGLIYSYFSFPRFSFGITSSIFVSTMSSLRILGGIKAAGTVDVSRGNVSATATYVTTGKQLSYCPQSLRSGSSHSSTITSTSTRLVHQLTRSSYPSIYPTTSASCECSWLMLQDSY